MVQQPHFTALLTFISEQNGGRKTPAMSGYRPVIRFPFHNGEAQSIQNFIDAENAFPGDTLKAEIILLNFDELKHRIYEGLDFDFYESDTLTGTGLITTIF